MNAENIGNAAQRAAANQVAIGIVDFFQTVEIKQQDGKRPVAAIGALRFAFQHVKQAAVVRQARKRIADRKMADLFEEPGVIEQCTAESNRVAHDTEALRDDEGCVEQSLRLRGCELGGKVHPSGDVDGTIKCGEDLV